jgi:hypothetical protein
VDRLPVPAPRRRRFETVIRIIDLIVYAAVLAGGVYALVGTPATVVDELTGAEWLIVVWALLLLGGGAAGFVGRLTRFWMVEMPATVLAFAGILIYFVVLGRFATSSITAAVAALLVLVAMGMIARRWAELQIFATDPDHQDFKTRMAEALRRRTANFVARQE